jgi:hypothetical protein
VGSVKQALNDVPATLGGEMDPSHRLMVGVSGLRNQTSR